MERPLDRGSNPRIPIYMIVLNFVTLSENIKFLKWKMMVILLPLVVLFEIVTTIKFIYLMVTKK